MRTTSMPPVAVSARLRRARAAVFLAFLLNGFVIALWVVSIPAVARTTGLSNAVLGTTLLALGAGSVIAMQGSGYLAARVGSRTVIAAGAALLAAGLVLIAIAADGIGVAIALLVLGLGNGAIDVAMNDQAVVVERRYERPIMSAFHALFSVGGALGAACGALVQGLGVAYPTGLLTAAALVVLGGGVAAAGVLPRAQSQHAPDAEAEGSPAEKGGGAPRSVVLLAVLAFAFMLAEGVVNDWSAVHATQHLGQDASAASLAYLAFAVTMTVGRLVVDRVVAAVGPVRLVRVGSLVAVTGLAVVIVSTSYPLTLVGWTILGLGLAGIVPQIFTAAGAIAPGRRGAIVLSRIVSAGYVGMLAGPAVIGWLSTAIGIDLALLLPLVLLVLGALLAPQVAPRRRGDGTEVGAGALARSADPA